jgi:hypothetical protein
LLEGRERIHVPQEWRSQSSIQSMSLRSWAAESGEFQGRLRCASGHNQFEGSTLKKSLRALRAWNGNHVLDAAQFTEVEARFAGVPAYGQFV